MPSYSVFGVFMHLQVQLMTVPHSAHYTLLSISYTDSLNELLLDDDPIPHVCPSLVLRCSFLTVFRSQT